MYLLIICTYQPSTYPVIQRITILNRIESNISYIGISVIDIKVILHLKYFRFKFKTMVHKSDMVDHLHKLTMV